MPEEEIRFLNMTVEEGLKLAVKALIKSLGESFDAERLDCAYVDIEKKKYTKLNKSEVEKILSEVKKKK